MFWGAGQTVMLHFEGLLTKLHPLVLYLTELAFTDKLCKPLSYPRWVGHLWRLWPKS